MDRKHQGVGGVGPARGSAEGRLGDPPAERARSDRPADAMPIDQPAGIAKCSQHRVSLKFLAGFHDIVIHETDRSNPGFRIV